MPGKRLSRRSVLVLGGSALALRQTGTATPALAQDTSEPEISDALVREILYEEAEPGSQRGARTTIKPYWFQQPEGTRPSANWPPDNVSFDYAHLVAQPNSDAPFELTAVVIEKLLELASIQRNTQLPKVLFGLRGCMLTDNRDQSAFAAKQMVQTTRPNHVDPKCLIGVWDTAGRTIAVYKASTVPGVDLMEKQIEGSMGCNMMPTGLHHYHVGPHRGARQVGAFRQETPLWVHRTKKKLIYAANDDGNEWDDLNGDLPFDDIHAAMLSSRKKPPFYSSAGCQVVAGAYSGKTPTGPWAEFRKSAGLAHPPKVKGDTATEDDGMKFEYVLFTGKEAQLVAAGTTGVVRTLRFGSSGPAVSELQTKLGDRAKGFKDGTYDRATLGGVIRWQVENKLAPNGFISTETAAKLGLQWT